MRRILFLVVSLLLSASILGLSCKKCDDCDSEQPKSVYCKIGQICGMKIFEDDTRKLGCFPEQGYNKARASECREYYESNPRYMLCKCNSDDCNIEYFEMPIPKRRFESVDKVVIPATSKETPTTTKPSDPTPEPVETTPNGDEVVTTTEKSVSNVPATTEEPNVPTTTKDLELPTESSKPSPPNNSEAPPATSQVTDPKPSHEKPKPATTPNGASYPQAFGGLIVALLLLKFT